MSTSTREPLDAAEAVIYVRVACVDPDDEGRMGRLQEQCCRALAAARGYTVRRVFRDEGVSGNSSERPGLDAMLAYLVSMSGSETIVLMEDMSRLARDISVNIELSTKIEATGARIQVCGQTRPDIARAVPHLAGTFVWRNLP